MLDKKTLIKQLKEAGIQKGDVLNMKVSLRSIGKLEDGAETLIQALLEVVGKEGTIVSDAFVTTKNYNLPFQKREIVNEQTKSYAGGFANAMIRHKDAYRSKHPIQKFVAIGKLAKQLTENHNEKSFAYGVLRDLLSLGGKNIKIGPEKKVPGVGTTHIAICDLNFEQRRVKNGVYYQTEENQVKFHEVNWVGGCGFGFTNLMPEFEKQGAILYNGKLGNADLKISSMKKTYDIEIEKLKENPRHILCSNDSCLDCRVSWSFSPWSLSKYILRQVKLKRFRKVGGALYYLLFSRKLKGQEK